MLPKIAPTQKFNQLFDARVDPVHQIELGERLREGLLAAEPDFADGVFQGLDVVVGKAGAFEADRVEGADLVFAIDFDEGRHVVVTIFMSSPPSGAGCGTTVAVRPSRHLLRRSACENAR